MKSAVQSQIQIARAKLEKEAPANSDVKSREPQIGIRTQSMVEKLRLGMSPNATERSKGLTPVEFLSWLQNITLNTDEVEYILGTISNKEIRTAVLAKSGASV